MTDDHGLLRRAMNDLSEHGGNTDMYQRALDRSRRVRTRNMMITSGAAAVVVLGIAAGVALGRPPSEPVTGPPSASPTTSATTATPETTRTSAPPKASSEPATTTKPSKASPCPVRTSTLQRVADLPDGYRLTDVKCWHDWASAGLIAPNPDMQGDGVLLFRHSASKGWRLHGDGSAWRCQDLGIKKIPGDLPPFCSFD